MIKVEKVGILLRKTRLEFKNEGVLNPAVIRVGDSTHLLYRAVRKGNYSSIGYCRLDGPLTVAERWITNCLCLCEFIRIVGRMTNVYDK